MAILVTQLPKNATGSNTVIEVEPRKITGLTGDALTVKITINDVENLYGLELKFRWDPTILDYVDHTVTIPVEECPGGILHEAVFPLMDTAYETAGNYSLAYCSIYPAPAFNGSGTICTFTFNVTAVGICELALSETELASVITYELGIPKKIEHDRVNGLFSPIHVSVSKKTITVGEEVDITGLVAQPEINVTILYRPEESTDWYTLANKTTDQNGKYHHTWSPQIPGKYEIRACAAILGTKQTSYSVSLTVKAFFLSPSAILILTVALVLVGIVAIAKYLTRHKPKEKVATSKSTLFLTSCPQSLCLTSVCWFSPELQLSPHLSHSRMQMCW
jgi:hypothetical protein